jgi:uncharacterized protein YkwD
MSIFSRIRRWFTSPAPTPTPPPANEPNIKHRLITIHNDNRLIPLTENSRLSFAAQSHADWMAANRTMSHRGAGGSSPGQRIKATGYQWSTYGENVAWGQATPNEVMRVWLTSPGHRRNIKSGSFAEIGIGIAKSSNGSLYWCVTFGSSLFAAGDNEWSWDESWATPEFEES